MPLLNDKSALLFGKLLHFEEIGDLQSMRFAQFFGRTDLGSGFTTGLRPWAWIGRDSLLKWKNRMPSFSKMAGIFSQGTGEAFREACCPTSNPCFYFINP